MEPCSEGNPPSTTQGSPRSSIPPNTPVTQSGITINIKKEELRVDVPDAAVAIFDDVDNESTDEGFEMANNNVGFIEHNGVSCWVCPGFRIPQIPQVSVVKRPLKDLCDAIKSSDIVLDPEYQRDVVWDDTRCEGLLVSLLMGYLPPPIIFNVKLQITETPNGKLKKYIRTCVDGKQRLTSILRFMRGEIGFLDSKHKKWYYEEPVLVDVKKNNSPPSILPTEMKEFFMSRFFICYEYNELSQSTEEEMFQLVQRGIALTPAEKLRAMSTEWATFARKYEDDYSLILNLSKQGRASGFRLILTIFAMIQEIMSSRRGETSVPTLQASPQALTRMLEEKEPINPALKLEFKAIFDRYESLIKLTSTRITTSRYRVNANSAFDTAPNFLRGEGFDHVRTFSPLELVSAALLICYHMDKRTDIQLLNDVKELRRYLRVKHKDLRVNPQCWTSAWEFIVGIKSPDNISLEGKKADDLDDAQNKHAVSVPALSKSAKKTKGTVIKLSRTSLGKKVDDKIGGARNKTSKNSRNDYSGGSPVSALGQSGAGLDTIEDLNGTGEANKIAGHNLRRRTVRASVMANAGSAATTVGMSSRVTTGRDESVVKNGKRNGKSTRRSNTMDSRPFDESDSNDSLSSVPSSSLNSPDPEEIFEHSHKRGLVNDSDGLSSRGAKKSRH